MTLSFQFTVLPVENGYRLHVSYGAEEYIWPDLYKLCLILTELAVLSYFCLEVHIFCAYSKTGLTNVILFELLLPRRGFVFGVARSRIRSISW